MKFQNSLGSRKKGGLRAGPEHVCFLQLFQIFPPKAIESQGERQREIETEKKRDRERHRQ